MTNKNLQPTTYHPASSAGRLQPNQGFAMLFSVLISSLLVAIGLSIFNITLKELTISTSARESQMAFYAANSGLECALYWDLKHQAFATSTQDRSRVDAIPNTFCNTIDVNSNITSNNPNSATTVFDFYISGSSSCANVTVEKTVSGTIITSRGYNVCVAGRGRRVERGLRATL